VDVMLAGMSSHMLEEWRAFAQLEPFGDERADFRIGQLTAIVANAMLTKGTKPFSWSDFAYMNQKKSRAMDDSEMLMRVKAMHEVFSAVWDKKNGNKSK